MVQGQCLVFIIKQQECLNLETFLLFFVQTLTDKIDLLLGIIGKSIQIHNFAYLLSSGVTLRSGATPSSTTSATGASSVFLLPQAVNAEVNTANIATNNTNFFIFTSP
jgi:hypothetical protein